MENVVLCPVCGHPNPSEAHRCARCRARLAGGEVVSKERGEELARERRRARRRRRLIRWGLVALVLLGLGGWPGYKNFGPGRFLSSPESDISAVPAPGDWPMYQRDPAHSAFAPNEGAPKGKLKWRFVTDAPILSSPAVVGGRVYLTTGDRRIVALDGGSGDLIWEHEVNVPVRSSPAVAEDFVYVGLTDSRVLSLHKDTGEVQWVFHAEGPVHSSPAVHHGVVYFGSGDSRVYALDAVTGEKRWRYSTGSRVTSDPAVNQKVVAVTSQDSYLYIIDTNTGKGRLDYLTSLSGSPALDGNRVYVADEAGVLRAIDWRKRRLPFEKIARSVRTHLFLWGIVGSLPPPKGFVWAFRRPEDSLVGTPAVAGDNVYIGSNSGALFAVNKSTGEEVWTFRADARITSSPSVADQTLFVGDMDGHLYAIDTVTGEKTWDFKTGGRISSTPVIAGGVLYLASEDGVLYAIE